MNFGKHGRTVLLAALVASTSTLVFGSIIPGVATADSGTIKVGDLAAAGKGNDPHIDGACIGVRLFGLDTTDEAVATFSTQSPTKPSAPITITGGTGSVVAYDLQSWLSGMSAPDKKQGYHLQVSLDGKQKTFWVHDASKGCASKAAIPAPPKGTKGAKSPSSSGVCSESEFLKVISPAPSAVVVPGSTVGVSFNDESVLNLAALKVSYDGAEVTPVLNPPTGGKSVTISYQVPEVATTGVHTVSIYAEDSDHVGDCGTAVWSFTVQAPATPPPPPCSTPGELLRASVTSTAIAAGDGVSVQYIGTNPLDEGSVAFTVDGQLVSDLYFEHPTVGSTAENIWYITPTNFPGGSHTASVKVMDSTGNCATQNFSFTSNDPGSAT